MIGWLFVGREFALLMSARAVSLLGNQINRVALAIALLEAGRSVGELGVILAVEASAAIALMPIGGALSDRSPRRRVAVAADLVRFGSQAVMATLLLTHTATLWHLAALQIVSGAATAAFVPAITGIQPETVPAEALRQSNAARTMIVAFASIAGPSIGGLIVVWVPAYRAIAADSVSFLISAMLLSRLRVGATPACTDPGKWRQNLAVGWQAFRLRRWLWTVTAQQAAVHFAAAGPLMVLLPSLAGTSSGGKILWASLLMAIGAGNLVGPWLAHRLPIAPLPAVVWCGAGYLPILVAAGAGMPSAVVIASAIFVGIAQSIFWTMWQTQLQAEVPSDVRSRVMSLDFAGVAGFEALGLALAGTVAGMVGTRSLMLAGAVIIVVATLGNRFIHSS